MRSQSSNKVESLNVATSNTSTTRWPENLTPPLSIPHEQNNTRNKGDSAFTTTEQTRSTQFNKQHAVGAQSSGGDAYAGSQTSRKNKHEKDNKSKTPNKSVQRQSQPKKQLHELNKKELIGILNRVLPEKDHREAYLQTCEQNIRHLQQTNESIAAQRDKSERELEKLKEQIQNEHKTSKTRENNLQSSIDILKKQNDDLKNKIEKNKYSKQKLEKIQTEHERKVDRFTKDAAKLHEEISNLKQANDDLKQANDDLKNRLSAVFGAKLQDNNPNIADLSDMNRPTKLAERFSELYDNEWTNCFEALHHQHGIGEKEAIEQLIQVCLTIYIECRHNASNDLQELAQALNRSDNETDIRFVKDLKDLKEKRKRRFQDDIKRLRQPMEEKVSRIFKDRTNETKIAEFWTKCFEICWLMAIQDPPVSMDTSTGRLGELFNATSYRPYTKSGKYVEFIVWPALRLTEDGSLLYKGVAQGTETNKQFFDLVDTISNESHNSLDEKTGSKVEAMKLNENKSQIGMGYKVFENTEEQNNGKSQKPADQRTDKLVRLTDDSKNQYTGNFERDVPTQDTTHSNALQIKHNIDTDGNHTVNIDSLDKNTQPEKRHCEVPSDIHNHNTSTTSEQTVGARPKQDETQPKKTPTTTRTDVAQNDNKNPVQLNASRRNTVDNSKMSGPIQNRATGVEKSPKTKNAPSAPSIENLSAETKNMIQTVSSNVKQDRKAQSVRGTADNSTVVKHTTSIPVKL